MSAALVAVTTRPVAMVAVHPTTTQALHHETIPAGTEVYVRETRQGFDIRLPGTLLTQSVDPSSITPA